MSSTPTVRLDRLLANLGYGSRKQIQELASAGAIVLDGVEMARANQKIAVSDDLPQRLGIDGEPVDPPPGMVLVMNKPTGVTCSHKEAGTRVYDLLPPRYRARNPQISSIGRLDKDTSGLLLLTDDGKYLHRVISPRHHVPKRYRATLARPLDDDAAALFAAGTLMLEGEDKPLLPAQLHTISSTQVLLTIHEGRYHQVRRMFAAISNHVEQLHREAIGGLELPSELAPEQWRLLSPGECEAVFAKDHG